MEHLSHDHEDYPNQHENSHKLNDETVSRFELDGKSKETETTTWSDFSNWGKAFEEQVLVSERSRSKRGGLWESQSGIQVGKLIIWVRPIKKNHNRVHQFY